MPIEFCPQCRGPRNAAVTSTRREKRVVAGRTVEVEIRSLSCERCGVFIRAEEIEAAAGT